MSAEENKALIQRVYTEGFNQGFLSVVDEAFTPDFLDRSTPNQPAGAEGVKAYIRSVRAGFPDIAVTIEDLITTEERVVVRTTWYGTHLGEYENLTPTGKQVMRTMIQIFRVENGKLCEEWSEGRDLAQQLLT